MDQLNRDIKTFLCNYTFNNIDILLSNRKILQLDEESLYDKLIKRRRGGYCFENNQFFFNELSKKGYKISRKLARVIYGETQITTARTHQITIVEIENNLFLVDVGFGPYTPCCMIPLNGKEVEVFNGKKYRVSQVNPQDFQLEIFKDGNYFSLYQFNLVDYIDADFKISNYYTNTHYDSKFTSSLILSEQTERGTKFINNLIFSEIEGVNRMDRHIRSSDEMFDIITKYFNISLEDDECTRIFDIVRILDQSCNR